MLIVGNCNNAVVSKFGDQEYYIDNREIGKRKEYILCNENHLIIGVFYSEDRAIKVLEEIKEYLKGNHTNIVYEVPIDIETEEEKKAQRKKEIDKEIIFLISVIFITQIILCSIWDISELVTWIIRVLIIIIGSICMYWNSKKNSP